MNLLPRLMLVADGFASGRAFQSAEEVQRRIVALVEGGVPFVQLRDHLADPDNFTVAARELVPRLRGIRSDLTLVVNTRADVANELGCGLHVRGRVINRLSLSTLARCGPTGCSAHDLEELATAVSAGFDYVTLSPIFSTTTHRTAAPLGLEILSDASSSKPEFPIFALGGINPQRAAACLDAGAHGVAVLSDLLDARDPGLRFEAYRMDPACHE